MLDYKTGTFISNITYTIINYYTNTNYTYFNRRPFYVWSVYLFGFARVNWKNTIRVITWNLSWKFHEKWIEKLKNELKGKNRNNLHLLLKTVCCMYVEEYNLAKEKNT